MAAMLASGISSALFAQLPKESEDASLRSDCRSAAKTLTSGSATPTTKRALEIISRCDQTGGPALQAMWSKPATDSIALEQLVAASSRLLDQRVYDGVIARARDTSAPRAVRFAAMRVLAAFISKTTLIDPDDLAKPSADTTIVRLFSTVSHGIFQRVGSMPLSANKPGDIRALFASLARTDPDPIVRSGSRYLQVWFSGH